MSEKFVPLANIPLTTCKGIQSSIQLDHHIYRWFLYLLYQDPIKQDILKGEEQVEEYKQLTLLNFLLFFIGSGIFVLSFFLVSTFNLYTFMGVMVFCIFFYVVYYQKKQRVSQLGLLLIQKNFSEQELASSTLYQLAEKLSGQYNTVSLVDAIYHLERMYKVAFLFSFLIFGYILYIDAWIERVLAFLLFYFFIVLIVNTSFFYNTYKKV